MVAAAPERAAARYLSHLDAVLPGRVTAFYLVGSAALDAFREGRSDVDFIAVVDGDLSRSDIWRLREVHARSGINTATDALHVATPR